MIVQQFFVKGLAHSSYLLGGTNTCAIVDPRRDVEVYLEAAKSLGMEITHILETHLHADFISGHLDLAEKTGAAIYAPRSAKCKFEHVRLAEGDTVTIEDMVLRVFETDGREAKTTVEFLGSNRRIRTVNLLEEQADVAKQAVWHLKPYEIGTVRLSTK